MKTQVFLLKLDSYEPQQLQEAIGTVWSSLELRRQCEKKNVLIKPNLLVAAPPERAVCTHPEVVRAIIRALGGSTVIVGDSPGFGSTRSVARTAGIADVCLQEGVELADFTDPEPVPAPEGAVSSSIPLASAVTRADLVINAAKLKTHALTRYTGAVKNLCGCLPGKLKAQAHFRMENIERFADYLLDVYQTVNPLLSIVDGIVAMEGNGPRTGSPRQVGVLLAGRDAVAVDAVACSIVGIPPETVPTLRAARRRGVGCTDLKQVEIIGTSPESVRVRDFKTIRGSGSSLKNLPPFLKRMLREHLTARPVVCKANCTACGICEHACPAGAVSIGKSAEIFEKSCIRCYCCQEMCPEGAVTLTQKALGRLLK